MNDNEIDIDLFLDGREYIRFESETEKSTEEIEEFEKNVVSVLRHMEDRYGVETSTPDHVMVDFMMGYARVLSRDDHMDIDDLFVEMEEGGEAARMNVSVMMGILASEGHYRKLIGAIMRDNYEKS